MPDLASPSVVALKVTEAAHFMRVSRNHAYAQVQSGAWPSVRVGRRRLVPASFIRQSLGVETRSVA